MVLLLDTHTFIWLITNNPRLSHRAKSEIGRDSNICYVSMASFWEMAIKTSKGRLHLPDDLDLVMNYHFFRNAIKVLPIEKEHILGVARLGFPNRNHSDPFDRLIIAQAISESASIITNDSQFANYDVNLVW